PSLHGALPILGPSALLAQIETEVKHAPELHLTVRTSLDRRDGAPGRAALSGHLRRHRPGTSPDPPAASPAAGPRRPADTSRSPAPGRTRRPARLPARG